MRRIIWVNNLVNLMVQRERVLLLENFFNIKGKHIDVSNVESVTSINNLKLEI